MRNNIITRIINPPAFGKLNFEEHQKRRFYNRGNLYGASCCLVFTIVGFMAGLPHLAYITLFNMAMLLTGICVNHFNKFTVAKHISLSSSVFLFVAVNYFYGDIAHTEIYLFLFPVVIILLFDGVKRIILYCTILFVLFMYCLYLQKHFSGTYDGDVTYLRKFTYMNYPFAFFMLCFMVYSFKSENIKYSRKIAVQKLAIEEKSAEITASITYAKRLQDAILPPVSLIKQFLPDSFVFYKPKDIVAGDFYWMERVGDNILIAAADCTGHGVPGALVSVVCSNALNRTVKEFHIIEPGKILDKVRELILETFEKSESNVQDGMDVSLCCINTKSKEAQWSGAYNALWYIRDNEIHEVDGDKQPIGKFEKLMPFNTHNLKLQKGTLLYLLTDGYADQFGGANGKKFKYKNLQNLLLVNASKPMDEQKNILESTFENWKGDLEQVDDILIIGIRV